MSEKLAAIKALYYAASKGTVVRDFDRAIDLLKSMDSEAERERATVYMEGLAQLRAQWSDSGARRATNDERRRKNATKNKEHENE
jgi:hypothetical protein